MKLKIILCLAGLILFGTSDSNATSLCEYFYRNGSVVFSETLRRVSLIVGNDLALEAQQEVIQKSGQNPWISPNNPFLLIESVFNKSPAHRPALMKASPRFNGTLVKFVSADIVKNSSVREEFYQTITDYIDAIFNRNGQKLNEGEANTLLKVLEYFEKNPRILRGTAELPIVSLMSALHEVTRGGSTMWEGTNPIPSDLVGLINEVARVVGVKGQRAADSSKPRSLDSMW